MRDDGRGQHWRSVARARLEPLVQDVNREWEALDWFAIEHLLDGDRVEGAAFRWSSYFARRSIGLPALQELAGAAVDGRRLSPLEAVRRVVDRMVAVGREGWEDRDGTKIEDWLRSIGEGGRVAAIRDAVTWVTASRSQLNWPPRDVRSRDEGTTWVTIKRDVVSLKTRIDLGPARTPGVIETAVPTPRTRVSLGYVALVRAIDSGVLPDSVTAIHLPCGERTRVEPTDDALERVLDLCALAIGRWAAAAGTGSG